MRYAIIADIHGNFDALSAVLEDAKAHCVNQYIFAGDYCASLPYPNEVVQTIRNLPNCSVIKGNGEDYLFACAQQNQETWTDGQFQPIYWCYNAISEANYSYLATLPKTVTFKDCNIPITVTHSSADVCGDMELKEFLSAKIAIKYQKVKGYSREKMLQEIRQHVSTYDFNSAPPLCADGIYIFGHTHMQWNATHGNTVFLNPGSCGIPLDTVPGAAYTLLTIDKGNIAVIERRVSYDIKGFLSRFTSSSLYAQSPVWGSIFSQELGDGLERAHFFLQFISDYANKINDPIRPYSEKTWTEAFRLWQARRE